MTAALRGHRQINRRRVASNEYGRRWGSAQRTVDYDAAQLVTLTRNVTSELCRSHAGCEDDGIGEMVCPSDKRTLSRASAVTDAPRRSSTRASARAASITGRGPAPSS